MNAPTSPAAAPRRRRLWPWVLGFCLAPFVVLGLAAVSYLTLDRDAAALRQHVMAASRSDWSTKVQVSVGRLTLGCVRTGLRFAECKDITDVRLALAGVKSASVGVYERQGPAGELSREAFFVATDTAMQKRGWTRLVGVAEKREAVLIYVPENASGRMIDVCLAVIDGKDLVVVSSTVDGDALAELVERKAGPELRRSLKISRL